MEQPEPGKKNKALSITYPSTPEFENPRVREHYRETLTRMRTYYKKKYLSLSLLYKRESPLYHFLMFSAIRSHDVLLAHYVVLSLLYVYSDRGRFALFYPDVCRILTKVYKKRYVQNLMYELEKLKYLDIYNYNPDNFRPPKGQYLQIRGEGRELIKKLLKSFRNELDTAFDIADVLKQKKAE